MKRGLRDTATLVSLTVLWVFAPDSGVKAARKIECKPGEVSFRGFCVAEGECCIEGVCPQGEFLQFDDTPKCTSCASAKTTLALDACQKDREERSRAAVEIAYKKLKADHPSEVKRLDVAWNAWTAYVDAWCKAVVGYFGEGSMRGVEGSFCREKQYEHQRKLIEDLKVEWPR